MTDSSSNSGGTNFNDDELADIMAEIEGLEKEALDVSPEVVDGEPSSVETESAQASSEDLTQDNPELVEEMAQLSEEQGMSSSSSGELSSPAPDEDSLQATIDREMEEAKLKEATISSNKENVVPFPDRSKSLEAAVGKHSSSGGSEMILSGSMSDFRIKFFVDGEEFCLDVSSVNGVCLQMGDGAQFTLPRKKKVA